MLLQIVLTFGMFLPVDACEQVNNTSVLNVFFVNIVKIVSASVQT